MSTIAKRKDRGSACVYVGTLKIELPDAMPFEVFENQLNKQVNELREKVLTKAAEERRIKLKWGN